MLLRFDQRGKKSESDFTDPVLLRVLLVATPVRLLDLALALLAKQEREALAQRFAPAGEAPAGDRLVKQLCIPLWDAYGI